MIDMMVIRIGVGQKEGRKDVRCLLMTLIVLLTVEMGDVSGENGHARVYGAHSEFWSKDRQRLKNLCFRFR